jgi:hypothetical protein
MQKLSNVFDKSRGQSQNKEKNKTEMTEYLKEQQAKNSTGIDPTNRMSEKEINMWANHINKICKIVSNIATVLILCLASGLFLMMDTDNNQDMRRSCTQIQNQQKQKHQRLIQHRQRLRQQRQRHHRQILRQQRFASNLLV